MTRSSLAVVALFLGGCAAGGVDRTETVDSLRTTSDERGLVASYTGGSCDEAAHLQVTETATAVEVSVLVHSSSRSCDAVGHRRTVSVQLAAPLAGRTINSGGRRTIPFDGARLLVPSDLPPGFVITAESGTTDDGSTAAPAPSPGSGSGQGANVSPVVTTNWEISYGQAANQAQMDQCTPGRGSLSVTVGPGGGDVTQEMAAAGTAKIGGATAGLWRSNYQPAQWIYLWNSEQGQVRVRSAPECDGDKVLDASELLTVARSMRAT